MKDLKYLAAYINPALAAGGLLLGGGWVWMNVIFVFVLVPVFDQIGKASGENLDEPVRTEKLKKRLFDWLLYLNLPVLYGVIGLFVYQLLHTTMGTSELIGNILSVGIVIGTCGINVAHELGHRTNRFEQIIAWMLLLPAHYQHFFVEHNRGHHKHVATPLDPASAVMGMNLYTFWFRSVTGSYQSAWRIEKDRLKKGNTSSISHRNYMIWFTVCEFLYLLILYLSGGWGLLWPVFLAGIVGILLLETINYLEHYGLRRKQTEGGKFERVLPVHSWNSNHQFGRIVLYELTRHSDHHYKASKKYQVLDHHDESPQLPLGYPAMILVALLPPLWFRMMDRRIPDEMKKLQLQPAA